MIEHDETGTEPTDTVALRPTLIRVPLPSPTLPPATHTNVYLVSHADRWLLVDAAGDGSEASLAPLFEAIETHCDGQLHGILISHEHQDHHLGLSAVAARYPDARVYAHAEVIARLEASHPRVDWVPARDGDELFGLELLLTEGHARGHFSALGQGFVLCADMISGLGTIVVAPPDGDMAAYFASLERLASLGDIVALPAHGGAALSVRDRAEEYLRHRRARETLIFEALSETHLRSLGEVTSRAYADVPVAMHPLAEFSCLAHLMKLVDEGRATAQDDGWLRV